MTGSGMTDQDNVQFYTIQYNKLIEIVLHS